MFPEWKKIGALLVSEQGGPSSVCYALQGQIVVTGVALMVVMTIPHDHALYYIVGALMGLGIMALTLCITTVRVALFPGHKVPILPGNVKDLSNACFPSEMVVFPSVLRLQRPS